jgi:nucleoside-diphosphate-sugar epimerase
MSQFFTKETSPKLNRKVLVTGGAGYVGVRLVPNLLSAGFDVRVLDTCWYGANVFTEYQKSPSFELVIGDIRDIELLKMSLVGCTDVIHLACISNDPSYDLNPKLGEEINFDSFEPLVKLSKNSGVSRFIYASSSSVYGVKEEENVTEELTLNPLTDYSKFKAMCEPILLNSVSNDFSGVVLRPATICGYSQRQRLDLSVNILTNHAITNGVIKVFGGDQFRPNLHIEDMCNAYLNVLLQPDSKINGKTYNVGGENLTIRNIATKVLEVVGGDLEIQVEKSDDQRSYRISSDRINQELSFQPTFSVRDAIIDLKNAFESGLIVDSMSDPKYFNIKKMQEVINQTGPKKNA